MRGFKTIGWVAATVLGVLAIPQVQELISAYPQTAVIVNGVVVAALRWVTTTPIFNK